MSTREQYSTIRSPAQNDLTVFNLAPFSNASTQLQLWTHSYERHEYLAYLMQPPTASNKKLRNSQRKQMVLEGDSSGGDLGSNISEAGSEIPFSFGNCLEMRFTVVFCE